MQCPNPACGPNSPALAMSHREGVEIDYCPRCRGVWLDRGELDKLIALSINTSVAAEPRTEGYRTVPSRHDTPRYDERSHDAHRGHAHHHQQPSSYSYKRKSWLGDMFDFD